MVPLLLRSTMAVALAAALNSAAEEAALMPSRHDMVLDTANGLAKNGHDFCTPLKPPVEKHVTKTCTVAVAAFGQTAAEYALLLLLLPPACKVVVYDKDDPKTACSFMPFAGIDECLVLPNVGREQHTWAYYVRTNYHQLPDVSYFIPADLPAHDRAHNVQLMLNSTIFNETTAHGGIVGQQGGGFWCINASAGEACDGFPEQKPQPLSGIGNCSFPVYCRGGNASNCVHPDPTAQPTFQVASAPPPAQRGEGRARASDGVDGVAVYRLRPCHRRAERATAVRSETLFCSVRLAMMLLAHPPLLPSSIPPSLPPPPPPRPCPCVEPHPTSRVEPHPGCRRT